MLAWKEKVADRLARLLADSPVSPSPAQAAVATSQVRSASLFPDLPRCSHQHCVGVCRFGGWCGGLGIPPEGGWDLGEDPWSRISSIHGQRIDFSSSTNRVGSYDGARYLLFR